MSQELRRQMREAHLAFCCEECVHFVADLGACGLLYPNGVHRRAFVESLADGERVWFCKMFEADG